MADSDRSPKRTRSYPSTSSRSTKKIRITTSRSKSTKSNNKSSEQLASLEADLARCRQQAQQILGTTGDVPVKAVRDHVLKVTQMASESAEKLEKVKKRESDLFNGLTHKEKYISSLESYIKQVEETTWQQAPQIRASSMDPYLNERFYELTHRLESLEKELQEAKAIQKKTEYGDFSQIGIKLLGLCQKIEQENQELRKEMSEGKMVSVEYQLSFHQAIRGHLDQAAIESEEFKARVEQERQDDLDMVLGKLLDQKDAYAAQKSRWDNQREIWARQRPDWDREREMWAEARATWAGKGKAKTVKEEQESDKDKRVKRKGAEDSQAELIQDTQVTSQQDEATRSKKKMKTESKSGKDKSRRSSRSKRTRDSSSVKSRSSRSSTVSDDSKQTETITASVVKTEPNQETEAES